MRSSLVILPVLAGLSAVAVAPLAAAGTATEVYLSTGADGEPSFSDVRSPGARRVEVTTAAALDDPAAEMQRRIEQTLAVANALEQSRLARQRARAEAQRAARARAPSAAPSVQYRDDPVIGYGALHHHHRAAPRWAGARGGRRDGAEPDQRERRRAVPSRARRFLWRAD